MGLATEVVKLLGVEYTLCKHVLVPGNVSRKSKMAEPDKQKPKIMNCITKFLF